MYNSEDYLTKEVLNSIESRLKRLYEYYGLNYTPKVWHQDECVYIADIRNIEEAINYVNSLFGGVDNYIYVPSTKWGLIAKISYADLNRWIHNIDLLINGEYNSPLLPSEALLPNDTLKPRNKESD